MLPSGDWPNSNGSSGSGDAGVSKLGAGADENSSFPLGDVPNSDGLSGSGVLELEKNLYVLVTVAVLIFELKECWSKRWWVMFKLEMFL